jgi:hypothetical protein
MEHKMMMRQRGTLIRGVEDCVFVFVSVFVVVN